MDNGRKTDLKLVLFPVEKRPVYYREIAKVAESSNGKERFYKVPRFEAIVDIDRNNTFALVSDNYRLVTNDEALELGRQCFLQVFSQTTADGMEIFNIIMPRTRSFCHIDFIHRNHALQPWSHDKWWPYLRVTNSYNRTKPLRFDLGFCRSICTNGVIFSQEHIDFKYYHTHGEIAADGIFRVDTTRLKNLEKLFIERLYNLKRYYVPPEHMLALACKTFKLEINPEDLANPRRRERFLKFRDEIHHLRKKYFPELGPNGYAALNVLTDFAGRPNLYISQEAMIDPLQKRCGDWITNFIKAIEDPSFDYSIYLGRFSDSAKALCA